VAVKEAACEQAVEPGLANTLHDRAEPRRRAGTAAGAARQVGLEPADGGQDRHHPAAQVRRVPRVVPQMAGAVITFDDSSAPRPLCDGSGSPFACGSGNIFGGKTPPRRGSGR
jgi:hypothetical protein